MEVKADQFVTSTGRRVLTDDGQPGMGESPELDLLQRKCRGRLRQRFLRIVRP